MQNSINVGSATTKTNCECHKAPVSIPLCEPHLACGRLFITSLESPLLASCRTTAGAPWASNENGRGPERRAASAVSLEQGPPQCAGKRRPGGHCTRPRRHCGCEPCAHRFSLVLLLYTSVSAQELGLFALPEPPF